MLKFQMKYSNLTLHSIKKLTKNYCQTPLSDQEGTFLMDVSTECTVKTAYTRRLQDLFPLNEKSTKWLVRGLKAKCKKCH